MFRLAVLVSGGGTNLQSIIDRIQDGYLKNIEIACVIASRGQTLAQQRAEKAGLATYVCSRQEYTDDAAFDQAILNVLLPHNPDLVVLAGYLSLLGSTVVRHFKGRIINIHPSLIPAFCGKGLYGIRPHQAVLDYGAKITGATVHFVDEAYDTGPVLMQKAVPVLPDDDAKSLQSRVMEQAEQVLLVDAIRIIAENKVRFNGRKTVILED